MGMAMRKGVRCECFKLAVTPSSVAPGFYYSQGARAARQDGTIDAFDEASRHSGRNRSKKTLGLRRTQLAPSGSPQRVSSVFVVRMPSSARVASSFSTLSGGRGSSPPRTTWASHRILAVCSSMSSFL